MLPVGDHVLHQRPHRLADDTHSRNYDSTPRNLVNDEMNQNPLSLIVGYGRCGSTWLLRLFDLSTDTLCRNEPYLNPEHPLNRLDCDRIVRRSDVESLKELWDEIVPSSLQAVGVFDSPNFEPKRYLYDIPRRLRVDRIRRIRAFRSSLGLLLPSLSKNEWRLPWFIGSQRQMEEAKVVLKLVNCPGWASFAIEHLPPVPVFHIVRHPGGTINSWRRRYLNSHNSNEVAGANRDRLQMIAKECPQWSERFGDIGAMNVFESEMWFWLYSVETIHDIGHGKPQYKLVLYEDLVNDTVAVLRRLFAAAGIEWSHQVEQNAILLSSQSKPIRDKWKVELDNDVKSSLSSILRQSYLKDLWEQK